MKTLLLILFTAFVLFLDWVALHDIIKGNEQDYFGEYSVLILSVLYFSVLIYFGTKLKLNPLNYAGRKDVS